MPRFAVSACLAGHACRYDGKASPCPAVVKLVEQGEALPLCPEVLGGLPVPRIPCERCNDRVLDKSGHDQTAAFVSGAEKALKLAQAAGCSAAILKTRSPSCGNGVIYDGTFSHVRTAGSGIWAEYLRAAGFTLYSEENLPPDIAPQ